MKSNDYRHWQNRKFRFNHGSFYHERFGDETASVVRIGPVLAHYSIKGMTYSMPLQNLDPKQNVTTEVHD